MTPILLTQRLTQLKQAGINPAVVDFLERYILETPPPGLIDIPPFWLAEQWQQPQNDLLEAFLQGTRIGLFDLHWHIHCVYCQATTDKASHLDALHEITYCQGCHANTRAPFDRSVEVTFSVNQAIQATPSISFRAFAEYWGWLETIATAVIPQGETWETAVTLDWGPYYLYDESWEKFSSAIGDDSPRQNESRIFENRFDGRDFVCQVRRHFYPGPCLVRVINDSPQPIQVHFAKAKEYPWLSAAQLASTQSFRDFFTSELIAPDESFVIRHLVVVFTDIKGSTALYERLGDSKAYALVKQHFKILTDKIRHHEGAVVKTIGDAVMASFLSASQAIQAVFAVQEAFAEFNQRENIENQIIVKIGVHEGPCIAVTSNDRLDYFGRTVNIASRIQGLSTGGDIILSRTTYENETVHPIVRQKGWQAHPFQAVLKGIDVSYEVVQITPPVEEIF